MPRWTEEHWDVIIESQYKVVDPNSLEEYKPTNADRIRAMNDEELAEFLEGTNRDYDISYGDYFSTKAGDFIFSKKDLSKEILKWLQSEAE